MTALKLSSQGCSYFEKQKTSPRAPNPENSKIGRKYVESRFRALGKIGRKYMKSSIFDLLFLDLFCPKPPKPTFDNCFTIHMFSLLGAHQEVFFLLNSCL